MQEIVFVAVEELEKPEYQGFIAMGEFEREHPLHMFYDYVMQFYGGLREDVLRFFCDEANRTDLCKHIGKNPEPAVRNEWYRRMVRLLQCNAPASWYELCCVEAAGKGEGYRQYFITQLAGYAEQGYKAEEVKKIFLQCNAAYLLEYQVRQLINANDIQEEVDEYFEDTEVSEENRADNSSENQEYVKILSEVLEGQNEIKKMLESVFDKAPEECIAEEIIVEEEILLNEPEVKEEERRDASEEEGQVIEEKVYDEENDLEIRTDSTKGKAFWIATLFQQIRLKRKSVQLRKMDSKQQVQELALLMKNKNFLPEDMRLVRNLINQDVSTEFLYTIIAEEREAVTQLQQMYEFISYQSDEITE